MGSQKFGLDLATEHTYVSQGTTFKQWLTLYVFLVMAFHSLPNETGDEKHVNIF